MIIAYGGLLSLRAMVSHWLSGPGSQSFNYSKNGIIVVNDSFENCLGDCIPSLDLKTKFKLVNLIISYLIEFKS
jgi:hypothetical protein